MNTSGSRSHCSRFFASGLVMLGLACVPAACEGANAQWVGGTDGNWATAANWSPVTTPGTGNTATFGSINGSQYVISLGAGVTVQTINFDNNDASYTIGAGAAGSEQLTLNNGGFISILDVGNAQHDQFINADLVLGTNAAAADYTLNSYSANHSLTVTGDITGGIGGAAGAKRLIIYTSKQLSSLPAYALFSGTIGGGTLGVNKRDDGILTLSGNNTFGGPLTIEGGTLSVPVMNDANADGPLGHSTAAVGINRTGSTQPILEYTGGTSLSSKKIAIAGTSGSFAMRVANVGTELTLSGVISGTEGLLNKTGPGTLILSGVNTYSGGTSVTEGTLKLSGAGTPGATGGSLGLSGKFDLNGSSQSFSSLSGYPSGRIVNNGSGNVLVTINTTAVGEVFPGRILDNDNGGTGTVAITKAGTGRLSFSGDNSYSGATLVTGGALWTGTTTALGNTVGSTTISNGASVWMYGAGGPIAEAITISGAGAANEDGALEGTGVVYSGLLKLGAAATVTAYNGTFQLTNPGTITGAGFTLTLNGRGEGEVRSILGTTTGGLIKNDPGVWTLAGANIYTGATTINAGILRIRNAGALGGTTAGTSVVAGATLQLEGGITTGAEGLTIRGAGAVAGGATGALENVSGDNQYAGLVILGADSVISSDAGTLSLTHSGTMTGAGFDLTLTGAGNGSIAGIIGTGTGTVTKTGAGLWTLSGANSFTGALKVMEGTLVIQTINNSNVNGTLGRSTAAVTLGNTGGVTGTLRYAGVTATSTKPFAMAADGAGEFQVAAAGAVLTLSGIVSGSGSLKKSGPGTLILTAANTFTGGAEAGSGILLVNNTGGSGAGTGGLTILSGGGGGGTGVVSGMLTIQDEGSFSPGGDPAVAAFGAGTFTAANVTLAAGSMVNLQVKSAAERDRIVTPGALTIADGARIVVTPLSGFAPAVGQSYDLMDWTTRNGATNPAALLQLPALPAGLAWNRGAFNATGAVSIVAATNSYALWKAAHFTLAEQNLPAVSGETADPDGDGDNNLLEYAFGTPPKAGWPTAIIAAPFVTDAGGSYFGIRFIRSVNTPDLSWFVETTDNPGSGPWAISAPPFTSITDNGDGTETVLWHVAVSGVPGAQRKFIRLKVVQSL